MLLSQVESLLFGGAAGSAKSAWMLLAATAFCTVAGWDALVLRSTYPELSNPGGLMNEAQKHWLGEPGDIPDYQLTYMQSRLRCWHYLRRTMRAG